MPLPKYRRFLNAIKDTVIYRLLDERLAAGGDGNDLLALLVRSMRSETGNVDRLAVRNELVTYFFAGFETTTTTLSWCIYELARHPEHRERVHADPSFATAVILETLHLYPPAWMLDFEAFEPVKIANVSLKKGDHAWISQYVTHRHPEFWENPERFQPERFLPDAARGRHKYAFFRLVPLPGTASAKASRCKNCNSPSPRCANACGGNLPTRSRSWASANSRFNPRPSFFAASRLAKVMSWRNLGTRNIFSAADFRQSLRDLLAVRALFLTVWKNLRGKSRPCPNPSSGSAYV